MKLPVIGIFCKSNIPTAEEQQLIVGLSAYNLIILNVNNLDDRERFVFDGVAGVVPERFSHFPTAEQAVATYKAELNKIYGLADGQPPVPPPPPNDGNTDKNSSTPPVPPPPPNDGNTDKNSSTPPVPPPPPNGFNK